MFLLNIIMVTALITVTKDVMGATCIGMILVEISKIVNIALGGATIITVKIIITIIIIITAHKTLIKDV